MGARGSWKNSKIFRVGAASVAVLGVAAGALYYTGTFERWRDGRAVSQACGGIVPQGELEEYLGVGRLTSRQAWESNARDDRRCSISTRVGEEKGRFGWLKVNLGRGKSSRDLLTDLARTESYAFGPFVTPIGNGWRGVLGNFTTPYSVATVVVRCGGEARDDLAVNVQAMARMGGSSKDTRTPEQRARFARIVTQTAANAAKQAGCEVPSGRDIKTVPDVPPNAPTPAGKGTGTCAGINAPTYETTADPLAPIEDCIMADKKGQGRFRLAAYYGPFVEKGTAKVSLRDFVFTKRANGTEGAYWTSTACPKQGGTAFFSAETLRDGDRLTEPDPAAQQAALKHFAERSARSHGCTLNFAKPPTN
ncbi:hypothetical protein [Streptomyces sp. NPDC003077]|uniref:hypothetical protein n=1 Tax=Streptomyces sp. NPDC003077 TaxID=3154443 RepID=UPI0033A4A5E4